MNKLRLRPRLAALLTTSIVCLCLLVLSSAPAWAKAGIITEFPIPTPSSAPESITPGPDGNLWFTEANSNKIGRITTK
jgi:streptogramin lyase